MNLLYRTRWRITNPVCSKFVDLAPQIYAMVILKLITICFKLKVIFFAFFLDLIKRRKINANTVVFSGP